MANREALRDLQARLASRLQAVQDDAANTARWLAVRAGADNYLLPLAQAGEIFALDGLQAVPHTRAWFRGVLNVRGSLYGVVDLRSFLTPSAAGIAIVAGGSACVVTLNPLLEVNVALAVSALAGLRSTTDFSASQAATEAAGYLGGLHVDAQGERWQEVDLQRLCADPAFLNISA